MKVILALTIITILAAASVTPVRANSTNSNFKTFIKEVNNIRHLKGLSPLSHSNDLQKLTDKHAKVIKEHCQIIREKDIYISALGKVSVIARCKGKQCRLTPTESYTQTLKGEAWSLAYRKNNIYSLQTSQIGVSFAKCKKIKTFVIISTE